MFIDRFGNALTNLHTEDLAHHFPGVPEDDLEVEVGTRRIRGLVRAYGDSPVGSVVAIIGSSGVVEIAQVSGHVADRLGLGEGDPVEVRPTR